MGRKQEGGENGMESMVVAQRMHEVVHSSKQTCAHARACLSIVVPQHSVHLACCISL